MATRQPLVLVIDDSEDIHHLVGAYLRKDYALRHAPDAKTGLKLAVQAPMPDLILLDVIMPGTGGFETCRQLKANPVTADIPVIFLSGKKDVQHEVEGLKLGAADYLAKPINSVLLQARVRTHLAVADRRHELEALVAERTHQLEHTRLQLIRRLCRAMEYHESAAVGNRVMRLSQYAKLLSIAYGAKPRACEMMMKAAPLHDIGKLGIPSEILRKSGKLSEPDWATLRRHPELGAEIIGVHDDPLLKLAHTLALTHHERWDGTGYPRQLKGEAIPWPGRVMALVDTLEAMTTTQFHREPLSFAEASRAIFADSGKYFDPAVVEAFRKSLPGMRKVREAYADKLGDMLNLDFSVPPPKRPAA
jgi:putative two-component system response regulator